MSERGEGRPDSDATELDETVVVGPREPEIDGTVVISGAASEVQAPAPSDPPSERRGGARRVRITLPDDAVPSSRAEDGSGVGPADRYRPRRIPPPPPVERLPGGPAATRAVAPAMPSVSRSSRIRGRWTLVALIAACLVSVGGLVSLGIALLAP